MLNTYKELPIWFRNRVKKVMEHNNYHKEDWITSQVCEENGKWSPCDLIIREELNNGGGSAKGFLGLTTAECHKCYDFLVENKEIVKKLDLVSEKGVNNWGFTLWSNWNY